MQTTLAQLKIGQVVISNKGQKRVQNVVPQFNAGATKPHSIRVYWLGSDRYTQLPPQTAITVKDFPCYTCGKSKCSGDYC